jgi:hypothetical protein
MKVCALRSKLVIVCVFYAIVFQGELLREDCFWFSIKLLLYNFYVTNVGLRLSNKPAKPSIYSQTTLYATAPISPNAKGVQFSPMVTGMSLSKTIEIFGMTKELERQGIEVFSLCVGEPDYQPPLAVLDAVVRTDNLTLSYQSLTVQYTLDPILANI